MKRTRNLPDKFGRHSCDASDEPYRGRRASWNIDDVIYTTMGVQPASVYI